MSVGRFRLGHDVGAGVELRQDDLPVGVGLVKVVAARQSLIVGDKFAACRGDLKLGSGQRCFRNAVILLDDQSAFWSVAELQRDRLPRLDVRRLRGVVQHIAVLCAGFLCDQRRAGGDAVNKNRSGAVGHIVAVGISQHRTAGVGDKKANVRQGDAGHAVDLLDQQGAGGRVAKVELHNVLFLSADIGGLRGGVDDVSAVAGQFLHNVGPCLEARDGKAAVGAGEVGADDRAARAAGAGEVLDLEHGVFDNGIACGSFGFRQRVGTMRNTSVIIQ